MEVNSLLRFSDIFSDNIPGDQFCTRCIYVHNKHVCEKYYNIYTNYIAVVGFSYLDREKLKV